MGSATRLVVLAAVLAASCADRPASTSSPASGPVTTEVANEVSITCLADGSIKVSTSEVSAQPDGVHLRLESRLDEPASVNGLGMDLGAGEQRDMVEGFAPGQVDLACWPFSEHGGDEPATTPLEILDPDGLYVSGEVACDGVMSSMIADFWEPPADDGPPPLDAGRDAIRGLRDADVVTYSGYPESPGAVIVIRDDEVVASYSMVRFEGSDDWTVAGSTICESSGLR